MLYAELGAAESAATDERHAAQLRRSRSALLHEHLWSWAPGYLVAVALARGAPARPVGELTLQALRAELGDADLPRPAAARAARGRRAAPPQGSLDEALDAIVTPVRTGIVLTQRDLHEGARGRVSASGAASAASRSGR